MNVIKQKVQKIRKKIIPLLVRLRIVEIRETRVSCEVKEVENGIYDIKISTR